MKDYRHIALRRGAVSPGALLVILIAVVVVVGPQLLRTSLTMSTSTDPANGVSDGVRGLCAALRRSCTCSLDRACAATCTSRRRASVWPRTVTATSSSTARQSASRLPSFSRSTATSTRTRPAAREYNARARPPGCRRSCPPSPSTVSRSGSSPTDVRASSPAPAATGYRPRRHGPRCGRCFAADEPVTVRRGRQPARRRRSAR